MVRISDVVRLGALVARLSRASEPGGEDPRVVERRGLTTPGGTVYDRYEPRGPTRATVVAVHGVLLPGRRDPRLVHFGRALARTGVACVIPTLEGLASCRWDPEDLDDLEALVAGERAERVGLVGFCFGAGYALVAAARPSIAARVAFVVCFGAYHDMGEVFDSYLARTSVEPSDEEDWDNWIYLHVVTAHQLAGTPAVPDELAPRVSDVLLRYCDSASPEEKRELYLRHLRKLELFRDPAARPAPEVLEALSPRGKLGSLQAAVSLIHDPKDLIVPPSQSEHLHDELARYPGARRHRLLLTRLISHTDLRTMLRPWEVVRLFSALVPLVGDASSEPPRLPAGAAQPGA